ncbi:hypothetical protein CLU79DRAFT_730444 [Phycomyces nitens]|nr:hypothetical protein CLU79DRAFT_730444 [Phycomyces nitens]
MHSLPRIFTMARLSVYHNPQCTKSRKSVVILEENETKDGKKMYDLEIVLYKKSPPSIHVLETLKDTLEFPDKYASNPWDYLLRPEAQGKCASWEEVYKIIQDDSSLLERPFVIDWDRKKSALGRPDLSLIEELVKERVALSS